MNRYFILILAFGGLMLSGSLRSFSQAESMTNGITLGIRQGNSREISRFFGPNVDLTLPGSEGAFSNSQAEVILRTFFSRNTPATFSISHQGTSRDGSVYAIGILQTRQGKTFRVYFLLKRVGENFQLHQLQFEPN
ncbi:MAG TPA: DUF4783 domain-containing protein [Bacteroidales bacterium]|nr:DUF4783 domain-containing protein [Bacteroidales bacterium]